jgi:hypothetical protein
MNGKKLGIKKDGSGYRTSDMYYAAYLRLAGIPLIDISREGLRVYFVFERTDAIRDLKLQYFNRSSKVVALGYSEEIRNMKNLTYLDEG